MSAAKLASASTECALHAEILRAALVGLGVDRKFDELSVVSMDDETRRFLDQAAYRFAKLQDTLGERFLPLLLDMAGEAFPESTTFAVKLNRLERLNVIPSAESWKKLRELRNQISHEYPDAPALRVAAINRFVQGIPELLACWESAERFLVTLGEMSESKPTMNRA